MREIVLPSPAKLNLILHVKGRRPDGFHELETFFEKIALRDEIAVRCLGRPGPVILECEHPDLPRRAAKNLVVQAAERIRRRYRISEGVRIRLKKRIPVAAGLGGGSGNAATVLKALRKLWQLDISQRVMNQIGADLGSDVPFFLQSSAWAWGWGRGDRISPVSSSWVLWHILVVPRVKMYSSEVFTHSKLKLTKRNDDVKIFRRALKNHDFQGLRQSLFNDLESSIQGLRPDVARMKERLRRCGVAFPCFSGSGPSIFGLTHDPNEADSLRARLSRVFSQVYAVPTWTGGLESVEK